MLWAMNQSRKLMDERRVSLSGRYSVAPVARYGQTSQTAASNDTLERWLARSSAVTPNACTCQSIRFARFACVTPTLVGPQVEPEVEVTHANLANLIDWHVQAFGVT